MEYNPPDTYTAYKETQQKEQEEAGTEEEAKEEEGSDEEGHEQQEARKGGRRESAVLPVNKIAAAASKPIRASAILLGDPSSGPG